MNRKEHWEPVYTKNKDTKAGRYQTERFGVIWH